jgi:hypothetical protein
MNLHNTPPPEVTGPESFDQMNDWAMSNDILWIRIFRQCREENMTELETLKVVCCKMVKYKFELNEMIMAYAGRYGTLPELK